MKTAIHSFAAVLLLTGPTWAQSFDVDITGYGQSENFFEAISGDLMVAQSGSTTDRFEGLDGTPLEGMTMRCFGSATILNGIADGHGNCVFTDPDGDKILQAWTVDAIGQGTSAGTWFFVGGTGRHQGVQGRGYYQQTQDNIMGTQEMNIIGVASWPEG